MIRSRPRPVRANIVAPLAFFALVFLVIAISFVTQRGWESPAVDAQLAEERAWQLERISQEDPMTFGDDRAAAELVVYSDYQCPFCAHWSRETLPTLLEYVDRGELHIVWRNVNLSGEASERGARAVYAAALQDRLHDFHQALVQDGRGASDSDLSEPALVDLAERLELDVPRFVVDMNSREVQQSVSNHMSEGQAAGATRTPSFLFEGQLISGIQPTEAFVANLEATLEAAGSGDGER